MNRVCGDPAIGELRKSEPVPDELLAHLSPLGWEHINLTGDYIWTSDFVSENTNGMWPNRASQSNRQSRVEAA